MTPSLTRCLAMSTSLGGTAPAGAAPRIMSSAPSATPNRSLRTVAPFVAGGARRRRAGDGDTQSPARRATASGVYRLRHAAASPDLGFVGPPRGLGGEGVRSEKGGALAGRPALFVVVPCGATAPRVISLSRRGCRPKARSPRRRRRSCAGSSRTSAARPPSRTRGTPGRRPSGTPDGTPRTGDRTSHRPDHRKPWHSRSVGVFIPWGVLYLDRAGTQTPAQRVSSAEKRAGATAGLRSSQAKGK